MTSYNNHPRVLSLVAALALLGGCELFGTGQFDSRLFVARYSPQFVDLDRSFAADPHGLIGYSITDVRIVQAPRALGAGFSTVGSRQELSLLLRSELTQTDVFVFRVDSRGVPRGGRRMEADVIEATAHMSDAIVTSSSSIVAVGHTEMRVDGSPPAAGTEFSEFLTISTSLDGARNAAYGDDGRVEVGFPAVTTAGEISTGDAAKAAARSPGGGFFVVGHRNDRFVRNARHGKSIAIAKLSDDGSLDSTFDGDGKLVLAPRELRNFSVSAINTDDLGGLLIAGTASHSDGVVRHFIGRRRSNGFIATDFGTNGWVTLDRTGAAETIRALAPQSNHVLLLLSSGQLRAITNTGSAYPGFGRPVTGSTRRTGAISLGGTPVDLLVTDNAIFVLEIREQVTYLVKYSLQGDEQRERRVGIVTPLFPDSNFLGAELVSDGEFVYVVGLVQ